jgi:ArsR family transcriptional regulator
MAVDLELSPKRKRPAGDPCCEPVVYPDVERVQAERMASVAKALGDPIRLQLIDVLRKHAGKVCVCELIPLFDIGQSTVSRRPPSTITFRLLVSRPANSRRLE